MSQPRIKLNELVTRSGLQPFEVKRELRRRGIALTSSERLPRAAMTLVKDMIDGSFKPTQGVGGTGDVDPILNDRGDPDEYTRDISKSAMKPELAPTARAAPGPEPIRTHQEPAISLGSPAFEWPHMRTTAINYLFADEVAEVHTALSAEFAGTDDAVWPPGVKDSRLLESATTRPQASKAKYPNVAAAAAALVHSLINNHPFHNGNKRTALLSLVIFLEQKNDYFVEFTEDQLYETIVAVASHALLGPLATPRENDPFFSDREVLVLYEWLLETTQPAEHGEHRLRWGSWRFS